MPNAGFGESNWARAKAERVRIHVSRRELSYWFTALQRWVLPEGERTIYVAASSRDIPLQRRVWVGSEHTRF